MTNLNNALRRGAEISLRPGPVLRLPLLSSRIRRLFTTINQQ
jgi:hypothetical protein